MKTTKISEISTISLALILGMISQEHRRTSVLLQLDTVLCVTFYKSKTDIMGISCYTKMDILSILTSVSFYQMHLVKAQLLSRMFLSNFYLSMCRFLVVLTVNYSICLEDYFSRDSKLPANIKIKYLFQSKCSIQDTASRFLASKKESNALMIYKQDLIHRKYPMMEIYRCIAICSSTKHLIIGELDGKIRQITNFKLVF